MTEKKLKRVMIQTLGCQMNVYDTGRMTEMLYGLDYEPTDSPGKADLVIVNTCAIREKAEQKVFSSLGRLCAIKQKRPDLLIAVAGCVAQQQSEKLCQRFEGLDLVLGTRVIHRLPGYVRALENGKGPIADVEMPEENVGDNTGFLSGNEARPHSKALSGGVSRYVTIMRGCDNFCAYCVVPYVRGRETSRPPDRIVEEVQALVSAGATEVTLLGQNVNSYGKKEGLCSFPRLLELVSGVDGLKRIRFVTSHPKDLSDELVEAFNRIDKLCSHIHLPVQSGSDSVLKRMNRKYSRQDYMERVEKLKSVRPDIAVTTDVIVGFPGETEHDFEMTLDLLGQVKFDTLFAFEYSDRPQVPARRFKEKVSAVDKKARLRELLNYQARITRQIYESLVGSTMDVLVEGFSRRGRGAGGEKYLNKPEMTGRSLQNRIVNFELEHNAEQTDPGQLVGKIIPVVIERACANSLKGKLPAYQPAAEHKSKGGKIHAA